MVRSILNQSLDDEEEVQNVFHLRCARHDKDRLEVNIGFDGLVQKSKGFFKFDIDFIMFAPKSLGLSESEPGEVLRNEMQSYFRLHSFTGLYSQKFTAGILLKQLNEMKDTVDAKSLKTLAIELDAFLKAQRRKLQKLSKILKSEKLNEERFLSDLQDMRGVLTGFRELLDRRGVYSKSPGDNDAENDINRELFLLNEYISHLYVHVLLRLETLTLTLDFNSPIRTQLRQLGTAEADLREKYNLYILNVEQQTPDADHEDFYLRRISLLKKYFSRSLYVRSKGNDLENRVLIPVYGVSAALAAAWAILIQVYTFGNNNGTMQVIGINTIAFISIGIFAYVVKDVMKDFFRKFFLKNSKRFFPDLEQKLYVQGKKGRDLLGRSKNFVRFLDSSQLSSEVKQIRYKGELGAIERLLGEDIFHYKKQISIDLKKLYSGEDFPWGFREILRYRFDRLMVSMEDAYKKLPLLTRDGNIVLRKGHRVYQVYVLIQARARGKSAHRLQDSIKSYRVRLDKEGILSCDAVDWSKHISKPNLTKKK